MVGRASEVDRYSGPDLPLADVIAVLYRLFCHVDRTTEWRPLFEIILHRRLCELFQWNVFPLEVPCGVEYVIGRAEGIRPKMDIDCPARRRRS